MSFVREGNSTAATIYSPGTGVRYLLKGLEPLERLWTFWKIEVNISGVTLTYRVFERSMNIYKGKVLLVETRRSFREPIGSERKKLASSSAALPNRGVSAVGERFPLFVPLFHFRQRHIYLTKAHGDWSLDCYSGDTSTWREKNLMTQLIVNELYCVLSVGFDVTLVFKTVQLVWIACSVVLS